MLSTSWLTPMLPRRPRLWSKASMRPDRLAANTTSESWANPDAAASNRIGNVKNARMPLYLTGLSGSGTFGMGGLGGLGGAGVLGPEGVGTDVGGFLEAQRGAVAPSCACSSKAGGRLYPGGVTTMMPRYAGIP